MDSSPQPMAVLRWSDRVVAGANAAFLALAGRSRADLVGRSDHSLRLWPQPDEHRAIWSALSRHAPGGRFAVTLCDRDDVRRPWAAAAHRVDVQGVSHVVLLLTDPQEAPQALQALRATLRYVEKSAPLGLWDWDVVNDRIQWSAGLEAVYGVPEGGFGGRFEDFMRHLHPADAERVERESLAMAEAGYPMTMEFRIVRPDGGVRWLTARIEAQFGADGRLERAHGLNMDVTEDRHREQQLRLSNAIIDNMAEGVVLCRAADGLIVYTSPRYDAMLGYGPGELLGRHGSFVNSPAGGEPLQTAIAIVAELRQRDFWTGSVRNRRKDGRDIWVRVSIAGFDHHEYGRVWVNVCADVTEAHLAQEARDQAAADLQRLSARMQEAIEAERAALSHDLHDQLGAALTGMRMRLEAVAACMPGSAAGQHAEILAVARMAQEAAVQTRTICSRLRPPSLDDLGVVETCRWYLEEWAAHTGLRVKRQLPRLRVEPGPGLAIDLFRILQELLTNVARHAQASEVRVSLQVRARSLVLRVLDDGIGFEPQGSSRSQGFGLLGMRERAQRHGGDVAIESGAGGTAVTVTLPLAGRP